MRKLYHRNAGRDYRYGSVDTQLENIHRLVDNANT